LHPYAREMSFRRVLGLFRKTFTRWDDDDCLRLGAALSFYALFSLFPLVLLCASSVGFLLGDGDETRARILGMLNLPAGGAKVLDDTLLDMQEHQTARGIGAVVAIALLFIGASAVFSELDFAFNRFWRAPETATRSLWKTVVIFLRTKLASLALVVVAGVFVLGSLVVSIVLEALESFLGYIVPFAWAWELVDVCVSTTLLTLTFAALFRELPQVRVAWRDVAWGAILTTALMMISKRALAWYLAHIGSFAAYGAVGSVLALLTWIYFTTQIIYFGGEFTRVYAEEYGSRRSAVGDDARDHVEDEGSAPDDRARPHSLPEPPVRG
jgi:membrane protein